MSIADYIHLHNHTQYSLLDGACRIDPFLELVHRMKMPAVAITDHGNLFGAIEFYKKARKQGVRPIIGCEIYVSPREHTYKEPIPGKPSSGYHLILLARNQTGYKNLISLVSTAFLEGFYHRPRVDKNLLRQRSEGLVATSACFKGELSSLLAANEYAAAETVASEFADMFGKENFFVEIQDHGIPNEKQLKTKLVDLARKLGLNLVATNDCHYLHQKDAAAHDALLCIQTGKFLTDLDRMKYDTDQIYVKTPEEMKELFSEYPEAIENTLRIAEMCNLEIEIGQNHLPEFPLPTGFGSLDDYLRHVAEDGLRRRYRDVSDELRQRLDYELSVITKMGYSGYFLIVKDFIDYARSISVRVGPGRGSATGSLVSYCLGIVNIDPIKYGLLFERFLNPERISLPDIDIDFADRGREKVIDYVIKKYGEKNVCQIITFGTMAARQSIRDVGRVMQIPYGEVDRIAKLIPAGPGQTIGNALKSDSELQRLYEEDQAAKRLIDQSQTLEGLARHSSTHAAGVVIAPKELTEFVPLFKPPKGDEVTTQYDMKAIEEIGLLKMDFLGLRTLTVIDDALELIKANHGVELDLDGIPLDDPAVYALFCGGHTVGIFQFESGGMRDYLRKLCPENLGDLIAMNALYRPGPLDAGTIDDYIKRKRGEEKVSYIHPKLEPILRETYGVIVYQEQVIKIAMELAGYSAGEGDLLRKAMGKKVREIMEKQKQTFLGKCSAKDIEQEVATSVFEQIETFARYGFNKSHAAGYSYLAFQTAYLKAHYPREFMAASLTSEMSSTDRIIVLLEECRRLGIAVLPPDVNHGRAGFIVENDKIRFGLGAVKNVGLGAIEKILEARQAEGPFRSLFDFTSRVDSRALNKRALESLIRAGAADSLGGHRAQLIENLDQAISYGQARQAGKAGTNQVSLFGGALTGVAVVEPTLRPANRWDDASVLRSEKDLLGCWVSGHPLESCRTVLSTSASCTTDTLDEFPDGAAVVLGGIITRVKINMDKKGKRMAFLSLEDFSGSVELVVFSDLYEKKNEVLKQESMVLVSGKVSKREEDKPKIVLDSAELLEKVAEGGGLVLKLLIDGPGFNGGRMERIEKILASSQGSAEVLLVLNTGQEQIVIRTGKLKAAATPEITRKLAQVLGPEKIKWEARTGGVPAGTDGQ